MQLALATGLPIIPVIFHGAHKRWPAKRMQFYPGEVRVEVLNPIDTKDWNKDNIEAHVNQVKSVMSEALG